jgi:hypothetical protein
MRMHCIILLLAFSACATAPKYNCDEACALQNMVCVGQTTPDWSGSTPGTRTNSTATNQTFNCAKDPAKTDDIERLKQQAAKKDSDKEYSWRCNAVNGSMTAAFQKECDRWRAGN